MSINITSTDTPEQVQAALGNKVEETVQETQENTTEAKASEETQEKEQSVSSKEQEESESVEDSETSEENDEESLEASPKKKGKGGIKKRIDKLNSKIALAEQEKEYWRSQALKAQTPAQEKAQAEVIEAKDQKPHPDDYETSEAYFEALSDWKVDQKMQALEKSNREKDLKSQYENDLASFRKKSAEFSKTVDDFKDVIDDVADIQMSLTVQETLMDSENGPELLYELAKNPEEYRRINQLSPVAAARAIGRFEAKLTKQETSSEEKKVATKTKAPRPLTPVGTKGSSVAKSPDDMTYSEFKKWREARA